MSTTANDLVEKLKKYCRVFGLKVSPVNRTCCTLNGISHFYHFAQSISVLRVVRWYFHFLFEILLERSMSNLWRPDHTPHSAASDLGLHCLRMSHKKDAGL